MTAFRSSFCRRCLLLDGDAFARTCAPCRTTDKHEAERLARIDARRERERLTADLIASRWHTPVGQTIGASVAIGLAMVGQAQAAPIEPDTAPFYWLIVCFTAAGIGLTGMILTGRWAFWRRAPAPNPYAAPFGDVVNIPQGRGE